MANPTDDKLTKGAKVVAQEPATAQSLPFTYSNTRSVHLRNDKLSNPQAIESGSEISLDPKFLLEMLGTVLPSQEQVQRLLLNPGEATKDKVVTQSFYDVQSRRWKNDYFFPVIVKTKSGQIKTGKMAFQSYTRTGSVEIKRADGSDPTKYQSAETTAQMRDLIAQNREYTEAAGPALPCAKCATQAAGTPQAQTLSQLSAALESSSRSTANQLWPRYKEFAKEFTAANPNIRKSKAGQMKRLFVKQLIEKFGQKDAATILAALTGFAEAPYRDNAQAQIAEMSAVLKVIDNRAASPDMQRRSKTLRDIGLTGNVDPRLSAILADWQFSAWNDRDNNLSRILNYNPDKSDAMTNRKMAFAFEAQRLMQEGKIEFIGKMNDPRLNHYHANYVNPNWDRPSNRVSAPTIKVDGVPVDLSRQRGARHVFYAGLA
ncbi:hypothetical protein K2P97_10790 [bacterium]|nr:hypothetical protein [bacterium]